MGLAYVDQLARDEALESGLMEEASAALSQARDVMEAGETNRDLTGKLRRIARSLSKGEDGTQTAVRLQALRGVMEGVRKRLRSRCKSGRKTPPAPPRGGFSCAGPLRAASPHLRNVRKGDRKSR